MIFTSDMIKPLRTKMGFTQEEFSRHINVGSRSVARWESGKVVKISAAVRVVLEKLNKKHVIGGKP